MGQENNNELVQIPLVCKENSDQRYFKVIKLLVLLLIVCNLAWLTSWCVYWAVPADTTSVSQDSTDSGVCNYIKNGGDIN